MTTHMYDPDDALRRWMHAEQERLLAAWAQHDPEAYAVYRQARRLIGSAGILHRDQDRITGGGWPSDEVRAGFPAVEDLPWLAVEAQLTAMGMAHVCTFAGPPCEDWPIESWGYVYIDAQGVLWIAQHAQP